MKPATNPLGKKVFSHTYPRIFFRYPGIIRWVHLWNQVFQLRNWYVRKAIKAQLKAFDAGLHFQDWGCGEGLHLLPYLPAFPKGSFVGVDHTPSHIHFLHAYRKEKELPHLTLVFQDIQAYQIMDKVDLLTCIGVLQYVEEDVRTLKNMAAALSCKGRCILYVPVNGRFLTRFYKGIFSRWANYDHIQGRKRIYSPRELQEKMVAAGFQLIHISYTYGTWGKLGYEIYTACLLSILNGPYWVKVLSSVLFFCLTPFIWLCMLLDFMTPLKTGNGMLIIAEKAPVL